MKRAFRMILPRSLAGQLIASLLLAIAVAQVVGFVIFASERREAIIGARRDHVLQRAASLVRMLDYAGSQHDPAMIDMVVTAATSLRLRFWIAADGPINADTEAFRDNELAVSLAQRIDNGSARSVLVQVTDDGHPRMLRAPEFIQRLHRDWHSGKRHLHEDGEGEKMPSAQEGRGAPNAIDGVPVSLSLSVALADGRWLNGALLARPPKSLGLRGLTAILLTILAVSAVSILIVRRLTRPLGELALAADSLGRGEVPPPLAPTGPSEIRRTTAAFNTMQERLHRFVADRTRMLAAISHDLRTPLTSLRLRAEFIKDDAENREKILAILEEMERITEATLAFARDEQAGGDAEEVDIAGLCNEIAHDLGDVGLEVSCNAAEPVHVICHPTALKRAIRNVAENGAYYGDRARIAVSADENQVSIAVEDDGPGIPDAEHEAVFEPFARLETSRNAETGGVGLGLSIARNILRAHGGDVRLENLTPKGLRVMMFLPLPEGRRS
ncbi:MAG: ATP-binding protein [Rhodospirillales bacterium]